jgi:hypothetical protein
VINPPVDEGLAPPPEGQGIQFKMKTVLEPGEEGEHCMFVKAPAEDIYAQRDEVRYSKGSHHFLLYETSYDAIPTQRADGTPIEPGGVFDCSDGATNGWKITKLVGGSQNAVGSSMLSFPQGVAMHVRAGAVLLMNAHYINATTEQLEPEVRINLWTIPKDEVKEEGDILFMYNPFIHVGMASEGRARMRCKVHKDITIQNVQSHMHSRGTDYEALRVGGQTFYTSDTWENVPVKDFGAGLQLKAGEWIDYSCAYQNNEMRDVFQGPRSTDEMCMLIGSFYPLDFATAHCSADPANPVQTAGLGAEWVGNGTATCADTFACIQAGLAKQSKEGFHDAMKCIGASDEAVSKEMSDALRCLLMNQDPKASCQTEFAACLAK